MSSISAHQDLLNASANNIANSNTKGFQRTQTTIEKQDINTVKAVFEKTENNNIYSNTDLTKEITGQIISYHAVGANAVAIKTQNDVTDTLLDIYA
jgi:flagellar hook protein FlgE